MNENTLPVAAGLFAGAFVGFVVIVVAVARVVVRDLFKGRGEG